MTIPPMDYCVFISSTYLPDPLLALGVKVVARLRDFPTFFETSDQAPLRGPWLGMKDEEFLATEIGASLQYQAEQRLILKWDQIQSTEEN